MASASQLANTLGAVILFDGEVPRTFTAKALETISGGFLVNTSGATSDVGSEASSYGDGDIKVVGAQDSKLFNGVALNNAGSNELVSVLQRGGALVRCGGIVSGGALVTHNASGAVQNLIQVASSGTGVLNDTIVGRAITTSASGTGNYSLVYVNA